MVQQSREANYSFEWAAGVVKAFGKKYARASSLVQERWDFDDELPIFWVARQPKRWVRYRESVKLLHRWLATQERRGVMGREVLNICLRGVEERLKLSDSVPIRR